MSFLRMTKPRFAVASMEPIRLYVPGRRSRLDRIDQIVRAMTEIATDEQMYDAFQSLPRHYSKADTFENSLLLLIFNNTNIANVGDATGLRGSSTAGSLYLSLHTADPGDTGSQVTSEITYTSYTRKAIARASGAGGFTVSTNSCTLTDALTSFVAGTGGSGTATYFGVGVASGTGAGALLYSGTITPNIVTGNGITPQLTSATAITED